MLTVDESWVNVQQKTFTKWSVHPKAIPSVDAGLLSRIAHVLELANVIASVIYGSGSADFIFYSYRLNNKLKVRDIFVNNLVPELSNGVSRL